MWARKLDDERGIGRFEVVQQIGLLMKYRSIYSSKPGYYAIAAPVLDNGTNTKPL